MEKYKKIAAFTLAETLITLAIIGVVSALVIPTVLKNFNDRKYNTARLKALKTFGEAGKMASINGEMNGQPTARAFVENVLSKYLKIVQVCDTAKECDFPSEIQPLNPNVDKLISDNLKKWKQIGVSSTYNNSEINNENMSTYVKIADGFTAKIFYNSKCGRNFRDVMISCSYKECAASMADITCMNVVYDMNGAKKPNHIGEDMGFVTVFWPDINTISVTPRMLSYDDAKTIYDEGKKSNKDAQASCIQHGTEKDPYVLPNIYDLGSISINTNLSSSPGGLWSSTEVETRRGDFWLIGGGVRDFTSGRNSYGVWCVRR